MLVFCPRVMATLLVYMCVAEWETLEGEYIGVFHS